MTRPLHAVERLLDDISVDILMDDDVHGRPVPRIGVSGSDAMSAQQVSAVLHVIAAAVELATPHAGCWRVQIEHEWGTEGSVSIELADTDRLHAGLALAVLEQVVQGLRSARDSR
jgi:hypothetical protein